MHTMDCNVMNVSNNATVMSYEIKWRGDKVYDLYLNGRHMASKGSVEKILEELKTIMEENVLLK